MPLLFAPNQPIPPIILASASPRRQELLTNLLAYDDAPFTVQVAEFDESPLMDKGLEPANLVCQLAKGKAEAVLATFPPPPLDPEPDEVVEPAPLIIGADTVVVVDDQIMGKPQDATEAVAMLNILQGRSHQVLTGLALLYQGRGKVDVGITTVWMDPMPPEAIEAYVATGEPLDKAGAYAIQGGAAMWIPRIQGCYFNVVGLPISQLARMIKQATK